MLNIARPTSRPPAEQAPAVEGKARESNPLFGKDGFTFWDFLDIINPLQHIPVVSSVYRAVTGDTIDPGARIAGGGLFGGPIGVAASLVSAMVEESTGRDPGEHALAMLGIDIGGKDKSEPAIQVAEAPPSDRVPPEVLTAMQLVPAPTRNDLKLSVRRRDEDEAEQRRDEAAAAERAAQRRTNADTPQLTDPSAILAAHARRLQGSAKPVNAAPAPAAEVIDGRTWFAAFPQGGGTPVRGVGTQPVTQQNVTSKFGVAGKATQGAAYRNETPPAADWAERAAAAYQKYFEMQQQRERQPAAPMVDTRH